MLKPHLHIGTITTVAVTTAVLVIAPPATAYDVPARLNEVAHAYSLGVGEIRCDSEEEWNAEYASRFAWSYTNLRHDYSVLAPFLCDGALNVRSAAIPLWQQAAGTWVLVHESFHLRHWRFRRNEAKVLCQAIVYFTDAASRLGASEQQANELYPYALALHRQITELYPWYRDPDCIVPPWILPPRPATVPPSPAIAIRAAPAAAAPAPAEEALARATQIAVEVDARYPGLRVTEASSTAAIHSLTLFRRGSDPHIVPADDGIYYCVCPNRARCPIPGLAARPATALAPRRIALELALRTFLETSADLVIVAPPTARFLLLVFERDALDTEGLSDALAAYPPSDTSPQLRSIVDANTLPHLYRPFAIVPALDGRDSLLAWPLEPRTAGSWHGRTKWHSSSRSATGAHAQLRVAHVKACGSAAATDPQRHPKTLPQVCPALSPMDPATGSNAPSDEPGAAARDTATGKAVLREHEVLIQPWSSGLPARMESLGLP